MKHRTGHLHKRGSNFYCTWRVNGKSTTVALRDENGDPITKIREAEIAKAKLMQPLRMGDEVAMLEAISGKLAGRKAKLAEWEDKQHPVLIITQAWGEFLNSPNRPDSGKATIRQYEFQWQAFADWMKEKHADKAALREVTKEIAEEYAGSMNHSRLSASTYNKHLNLLTLVFRVVKHKARLTGNVWEDIQRKRIVTNTRRELTIDELRNVCQAATGELQTLLALGIYSGLRLGDCTTLRWAEVDLQQGLIRRIPNKTARHNPTPVIVPIHSALRRMLLATPVAQRGEYVLPETASLYIRRTDMVTDMVQSHFKKCGITLHKTGTGKDGTRAVVEVGFHSLRHTFVSMCRASDAPLAVVESIVGHSNPAMTRHYTHVGELAKSRAVAALPSVVGGEIKPAKLKQDNDEKLRELLDLVSKITVANCLKTKAAMLEILDEKIS